MAKKRNNQEQPNQPDGPLRESVPDAPATDPAPHASSEEVRLTKEPTSGSNPFYGCAILLIAITTFSFIILWSLYSGLKQSWEIDTFTETNAPPLAAVEVGETQKTSIRTKLDAFAQVAKVGKPVTLTLSLEELNAVLVLAGESGVADYRGMLRFTGIDAPAQKLKADIRWQMNNLPFVQAAERFLVGQATFKPVIENNALELHIEDLNVPGKTVSEGFLRHLRGWPWLNLAKLKPEISAPLAKVTKVEFSADGMLLVLHCGDTSVLR